MSTSTPIPLRPLQVLPEFFNEVERGSHIQSLYDLCKSIIEVPTNDYRLIRQAVQAVTHLAPLGPQWRANVVGLLLQIVKDFSYR